MPKREKACPLGLIKRSRKGLENNFSKRNIDQRTCLHLINKYDLKQPVEFRNLLLTLDIANLESINFIKEVKILKNFKIRNLSGVIINHIPSRKSDAVVDLLESLSQQKLTKLMFDHYSYCKIKNFNAYAKSFCKVAPRVTGIISITRCVINQSNFNSLILASTNVEQLKFARCTIDSYGIKKRIPRNYTLKIITFIECGNKTFSDWDSDQKKFEGLLQTICRTGANRKLQKIELCDNVISVSKMHKICSNYNLPRVKFEILDEELQTYTSFTTPDLV
ncbi:unnamed protein product [Moneuplotes crassus]|uniref:Uncharacterized protein n=1 Tax=Euplotes crassus TaxID=5936 RepID=A0AAD1XS93_EUPCR|nr:unnamed protein product [Moneuplotes crassus]